MGRRSVEAAAFGFVGCYVAMILALVPAGVAAGAYIFQFNLWNVFGKDVPWYLDVVGGLAFNGVNVLVAVGTLIARAMGVPTPFYPL